MSMTDRADRGKTKKRAPRPIMSTFVSLLILCGVGYYVWTQPVGLEVKRMLYTVVGPVEQVIHDLLTVE